jgi:hypothetical protein
MSDDELQGVVIEGSAVEPEAAAQPVEGSDLAPETVEVQETKTEVGDDNGRDKTQEAINKQHRKFRDEERRNTELQAQLETVQGQLNSITGSDQAPYIPEMPEVYDEDYTQKVGLRDQAIANNAAWNANQHSIAAQRNQAAYDAQVDASRKQDELASKYAGRVKDIGLDGAAMQQAAEVVAQYQLPNEIIDVIMRDEDGPLFTQYLATDIAAMDALARMPLAEAGMFIERNVRAKALTLRPKSSNAPPPPETLGGGGVADDDPILRGVTIE